MPDPRRNSLSSGRTTSATLNKYLPPAPSPVPQIPPAIARPAPAPTPSSFQRVGGGIAPVQNYQPAYSPPAQTFFRNNVQTNYVPPGVSGGGAAGIQQAPPAAPPAPPKPPIDYSTYSEDQLAGVDSAFGEQKQMFRSALDKFMGEDKRQRGEVDRDRDVAIEGIGRNEVMGLTSLNEDFAARGLGRSGLQLNAVKEATDQYGRQRTNVRDGHTKSIGDLNARKEKMDSDTTNSIAAARREAYARLAAKQEL